MQLVRPLTWMPSMPAEDAPSKYSRRFVAVDAEKRLLDARVTRSEGPGRPRLNRPDGVGAVAYGTEASADTATSNSDSE